MERRTKAWLGQAGLLLCNNELIMTKTSNGHESRCQSSRAVRIRPRSHSHCFFVEGEQGKAL